MLFNFIVDKTANTESGSFHSQLLDVLIRFTKSRIVVDDDKIEDALQSSKIISNINQSKELTNLLYEIENIRNGIIHGETKDAYDEIMNVHIDSASEILDRVSIEESVDISLLLRTSITNLMYRHQAIWDLAVTTFESKDLAKKWLNTNNESLGGEKPISLLDTDPGTELVQNALYGIEYSMVG